MYTQLENDIEHARPAETESDGDIGGEDDQKACPCHPQGAPAGNAFVQVTSPG